MQGHGQGHGSYYRKAVVVSIKLPVLILQGQFIILFM